MIAVISGYKIPENPQILKILMQTTSLKNHVHHIPHINHSSDNCRRLSSAHPQSSIFLDLGPGARIYGSARQIGRAG